MCCWLLSDGCMHPFKAVHTPLRLFIPFKGCSYPSAVARSAGIAWSLQCCCRDEVKKSGHKFPSGGKEYQEWQREWKERVPATTGLLMLHLIALLLLPIVLLLCSTVRLLHPSLRCPSWHEIAAHPITLVLFGRKDDGAVWYIERMMVLFGRKDCLKHQNEGTQTMASTSECLLFAFI